MQQSIFNFNAVIDLQHNNILRYMYTQNYHSSGVTRWGGGGGGGGGGGVAYYAWLCLHLIHRPVYSPFISIRLLFTYQGADPLYARFTSLPQPVTSMPVLVYRLSTCNSTCCASTMLYSELLYASPPGLCSHLQSYHFHQVSDATVPHAVRVFLYN